MSSDADAAGRPGYAIHVECLSKLYQLRRERQRSLAETVSQLARFRREPQVAFWALRDVSFTVPRGSALGIVGRNGSGKSTLLKILAGTIVPTSGYVEVQGRVSALIELGAGFHPAFTGRDNVFVAGALLGISESQMRRKFDQIVDFAELADFIDTPLKYYSSGMLARLGFALSISVDSDILILDEVLAVGDAGFQQKCFGVMREYRAAGRTIILVSHSVSDVASFCDLALWLESGRVVAEGLPANVGAAYLQATTGQVEESSPITISIPPTIATPGDGRSGEQ